MRQSVKLFLFATFPLLVAQSVPANEHYTEMVLTESETQPEQQIISASGVISVIDRVNKKITIAHEAITALGWPAMTMRFTFTAQNQQINALKVGDTVNFTFTQRGNVLLIKEIGRSGY
ncbi:Cation efflux system protein CusF [Mixta theicola]|nr:copper-binding protein [Mixta theicola]QHM75478.1 Cation efflux system protein CusF [Mixta theicola]